MRPGPPSEILPAVAARLCDDPCPQACGPACYDWCCYPSVQEPTPSVQLVMVPVQNTPAPAMPPPPAPLQYPMNYLAPGDVTCSPQPCSAKKQEVASKANQTVAEPIKNTNSVKKHRISKKHHRKTKI